MTPKSNRRGFFSKAVKAIVTVGAGASSADVSAKGISKKIKLLTADGQMVEVDQEVLNQQQAKGKTTNKDILDWSNKNES